MLLPVLSRWGGGGGGRIDAPLGLSRDLFGLFQLLDPKPATLPR
jgi:hypothetical protein